MRILPLASALPSAFSLSLKSKRSWESGMLKKNVNQDTTKYPDQKENIEDFRLVYEALKFLQPIEMDVDITLYQYYDDDGKPSVVDVSGINLHPDPTDVTIGLAIEFTSWNKWLGMGIDPMTVKTFSETEIICHCLNEMTYAGFEEKDIEFEFAKLKSVVDDYRAMSEEEKEKKRKEKKRIPSALRNLKQD